MQEMGREWAGKPHTSTGQTRQCLWARDAQELALVGLSAPTLTPFLAPGMLCRIDRPEHSPHLHIVERPRSRVSMLACGP